MATKQFSMADVLSRSFLLDSNAQEGKLKTALFDSSGNLIGPSNPLDISEVPGPIQGRNFYYEDLSFVTGDSPITLDVNTDLGRNSVDGTIINDGPGNILVEISDDGTNYGEQITLTDCDDIDLKNWDVDKIRLTWVSDSSYRVVVL